MQCERCNKFGDIYIRHTDAGEVICNNCEWADFWGNDLTQDDPEGIIQVTEMNENELQYPFDDKAAQYAELSDAELKHAREDAVKASERMEELARDGFTFAGRKGPNWYADDVHTIRMEQNRRAAASGQFGRCIDLNTRTTAYDGTPE